MARIPVATSCLLIAAAPALAQPAAPPAVPFPHPAITEVFFHVPRDSEGDPSLDGVRDPVGDEFVEIANLHDRPIDITGYTLADRGGQITFTFPRLTLEPGEVVVLFNGRNTTIKGPVGSAAEAPTARNPNFNRAWVFTLGNTQRNRALNNQKDRVVLSDPAGAPVDMVVWGETDMRDYISQPRIAYVKPSPGCSVQRVRDTGELLLHTEIDGALFSPGWIPDRVTVADAEDKD